MINMGELFRFDRIGDSNMARVPLSEHDLEKSLVQPGDLLFARRSLQLSGAGRCSIIAPASEARTFESSLIRVRLDTDRASPDFYFYFFKSRVGRELMDTIVEQAVVAGIRASDLKLLNVPVPPISEQRGIAATLGALDDKIESNIKMNRLLEDLAQAYFKLWFVELRPWEGTTPPTWERGCLADILRQINEPIKAGENESLPYIPIDSLPMRSLALEGWRPNAEAQSSLQVFAENDILIGAMRVYFHRVAVMPFAGITRTTCFVLRPHDSSYLEYALLLCNEESTIDYADSTSKGSTMPYAVWSGGLADMPIAIPPQEIASKFSDLVSPLIARMRDRLFENIRLAALRDALLPELLSGRIRVPEAEQAVAEVVA